MAVAEPAPKPLVGPNLFYSPDVGGDAPALPADVMSAWRGLWHAVGTNLPFYINHSRANRRALRAAVRRPRG